MLITGSPNNDEHPAEWVHAKRDEPLFTFRIRVGPRECERILEDEGRVSEIDPVLREVGARFSRIPFIPHRLEYARAYTRLSTDPIIPPS